MIRAKHGTQSAVHGTETLRVTARRPLLMALLTAAMVCIAVPAFGYSSELTAEAIENLPAYRLYVPDPGDPSRWE